MNCDLETDAEDAEALRSSPKVPGTSWKRPNRPMLLQATSSRDESTCSCFWHSLTYICGLSTTPTDREPLRHA
eukprot:15453427-Alexandrium_andersonii.AAC.1